MNHVVQKVTAFVVQTRGGREHLLLFRHPQAGIQFPAGTVEEGESVSVAAVREAGEETGLKYLTVRRHLGHIENELKPGEAILATTTHLYADKACSEPSTRKPLARGVTVELVSTDGGVCSISYSEYDLNGAVATLINQVAGWVPQERVATVKERYFVLVDAADVTNNEWEVPSDHGHVFRPFWVPLGSIPDIVEAQRPWLGWLYDKLPIDAA